MEKLIERNISGQFVKSKLYGVGIDDTDYPKEKRIQLNGVSKIIWYCETYSRWKNMLKRCYTNSDPCYTGVFVCDEWLYFSNYKRWFDSLVKPPYEFDVDKDLLQGFSRIYSPETCLFLPRKINTFLAINGKGTPGAYFEEQRGLFQSYCTGVDGKRKHLGRFKTELEAHGRWQEYKMLQIDILASLYEGDEYLDRRVIPTLFQIKERIMRDFLKGEITKNLKVLRND